MLTTLFDTAKRDQELATLQETVDFASLKAHAQRFRAGEKTQYVQKTKRINLTGTIQGNTLTLDLPDHIREFLANGGKITF